MSKTLHFKIELVHSPVPIWRRFQVREDYRMDRFHQVIQIVMGWANAHLHEFRIKDKILTMTNPDWDVSENEEEVSSFFLNYFNLKPGDKFIYLYDFGDGWEHLITVEKITDHHLLIPICEEGQNHCPPEDCGGIPGYSQLLEILKDPKHGEYYQWVSWLPDNFDPHSFPLDQVNGELLLFGQWHNKHPRKKSTPWHQLDD